jgi:lysozyme
MEFSQDAIDLIKEYEGFKARSYKCPAGHVTIGYGHKLIHSLNAKHTITEQEARAMLYRDLLTISSYINQKVKVTLKQCQYDALCSLVYNWGCFKFGRSQGLILLNQGRLNLAADEFFSREKGVVHIRNTFCNGLYKRRQTELKLWNGKK